MNLEDRLSQHLKQTGAGVSGPPADPSTPLAIAGRRQRRRWMAGSATAVLLVAIAGFGAFRITSDPDRSVDVIAVDEDDDTGDDPDATDDANDDDTTSDEDGFGGGTDVPGDGPGGSDAAASLPESTGPVLEWEAVDLAPGPFVNQVVWHDGAFVAVIGDEEDFGLQRSVDGRTWESYDEGLPDNFVVFGITSAGSSLLVWGAVGDPNATGLPASVFLSTSDGSWTDLGPLPQAATAPTDTGGTVTVTVEQSVDAAAAVGDLVVVSVVSFPNIDVPTLLADAGIDVDLDDPDQAWGYSDDGVFICGDVDCDDQVDYSFESLGITEADQALLNSDELVSSTYASVGGGAFVLSQEIDSSLGPGHGLVASGDAVIAAVPVDSGIEIQRTVDGLTWEPIAQHPDLNLANLDTDGDTLFAIDWNDGKALRSTDGGLTWEEVPTGAESIQLLDGVRVGPGGMAATFMTGGPDGGVDDNFSLEKDGYTITWTGDESLTVVDAEGNTVLSFDEEELAADEPPETVISDEGGDEFFLTFLDPDTLEPLVTLTEEDLNEAFGISEGGFGGVAIGWTEDGGQTWGWQTTIDAFGEDGWATLAVGDTSVLAVVYPSDSGEIPSPRLFVAPIG